MDYLDIDKNDVQNWIGNDLSKEDLIEVIAQLVNGSYPVSELRQDIINSVWEGI